MSLTTKRVQKQTVPGAQRYTVTDVTFDSSYENGGEPITAKELGLNKILFTICEVINGSEEATVRPTNAFHKEGKVHLIDSATGKEVASTKNMEKVVVRVLAFGF